MQNFSTRKVSWVPRGINIVALEMAKYASSIDDSITWGFFPTFWTVHPLIFIRTHQFINIIGFFLSKNIFDFYSYCSIHQNMNNTHRCVCIYVYIHVCVLDAQQHQKVNDNTVVVLLFNQIWDCAKAVEKVTQVILGEGVLITWYLNHNQSL